MYDYNNRNKIIRTKRMLSEEDITVTQTFPYCMFKRCLGVQKTHENKTTYVNVNDVK